MVTLAFESSTVLNTTQMTRNLDVIWCTVRRMTGDTFLHKPVNGFWPDITVGWLVGRSVGRSFGWTVGQTVGWSVINWLVGRSVSQRLIRKLIDWLIDWLMDGLVDWLIDWLIDWLFDWMMDGWMDGVSSTGGGLAKLTVETSVFTVINCNHRYFLYRSFPARHKFFTLYFLPL